MFTTPIEITSHTAAQAAPLARSASGDVAGPRVYMWADKRARFKKQAILRKKLLQNDSAIGVILTLASIGLWVVLILGLSARLAVPMI